MVAVALSLCHILIANWRLRAMVTLLANLVVPICAYKAGKACRAWKELLRGHLLDRKRSCSLVWFQGLRKISPYLAQTGMLLFFRATFAPGPGV